jgi:hypothetical protein
MPEYFFDTRINEELVPDDTELKFTSLEKAKTEATKALAELAREVLPSSVVQRLAIEVRTAAGPVLRASLRFELEQLS